MPPVRQLSRRAQMERPIFGPDPGDQALIDTMVEQGCDPREAGVWRDHMASAGQGAYGRRLLRFSALAFYHDVQAMGRGNAAARDRVDFVRSAWDAQTKAQRERAEQQADIDADARRAGA